MNEEWWLRSVEPAVMATFATSLLTPRKLRLAALAVHCRMATPAEHWLDVNRAAVLLVQYADCVALTEDQQAMLDGRDSVIAGLADATDPSHVRSDLLMSRTYPHERLWCDTIREVIGNPFHNLDGFAIVFRSDTSKLPVKVHVPLALRRWQDGTIVSLARSIYDGHGWNAMPILGDALEDAGCTNVGVLDHCRGPHLHCRGCWLIDYLLGKK